jgi:phosphoglycerate dehydrogenase-like enzyme
MAGPRFIQGAPDDIEAFIIDYALSDQEKIDLCKDVEALMLLSEPYDFEFLRSCPSIKLIQSFSAGNDLLDLRKLAEIGIPVASNGGSNAITVAEHTIGLMVAIVRNMMSMWNSTTVERKWRSAVTPRTNMEITGKTVGLVGLGPIGGNVARLLRGFDVDTIFYDVAEVSADRQAQLQARPVAFDEVFRQSDIVSLHVPLSSRTRKLVGARELGLMKPSAYLINTCRGGVVDEQALYETLKDGRIAGAGLDVLEDEPTPPDNPLFDLPNVIITPHSAAGSRESSARSVEFCYGNVKRALAGEQPESLITSVD